LTRATCDWRSVFTVWGGRVRCRARYGASAALCAEVELRAIVAGADKARERIAPEADPLPETSGTRRGFEVTAICDPSRFATWVPDRTDRCPKCVPKESVPTKFQPRPQSMWPRSKTPLTEK
jgi:hypothetical protein